MEACKILVTGANGQLGNCLREIAPAQKGWRFVFTDVDELDITDQAAVAAMMDAEKPAWVINAAAYTAVDKAESDEAAAHRLNVTAVSILAAESTRIGAGLVHVSTDYVFEGTNPYPLTEDEPTNPQSVYGLTKLQGEEEAAKNPKNIIIRTSWLYSVYGNNFVKTMMRLGGEKERIGVVADQWGSPTSAHDLAGAIMAAVGKPQYGIFHYSDLGTTSWALFAEEIMTLAGLDCRVDHITTEQYPTPARRPAFSILDKSKFMKAFGAKIPEWEASLEEVIEKLNKA